LGKEAKNDPFLLYQKADNSKKIMEYLPSMNAKEFVLLKSYGELKSPFVYFLV
jgi:hypothetical protein